MVNYLLGYLVGACSRTWIEKSWVFWRLVEKNWKEEGDQVDLYLGCWNYLVEWIESLEDQIVDAARTQSGEVDQRCLKR